MVLAVWLDYWLRGEIGIAKKFVAFVNGQWGTGVLIGGGIFYVLLLSLPFVPGVELGVLLMCVYGKEGIVFADRCSGGLAGASACIFGRPSIGNLFRDSQMRQRVA